MLATPWVSLSTTGLTSGQKLEGAATSIRPLLGLFLPFSLDCVELILYFVLVLTVGGLYLSGECRRHVRLPGPLDRETDELGTGVAVPVPGGTESRYNTKLGLTVVTWNKLSESHSSGRWRDTLIVFSGSKDSGCGEVEGETRPSWCVRLSHCSRNICGCK